MRKVFLVIIAVIVVSSCASAMSDNGGNSKSINESSSSNDRDVATSTEKTHIDTSVATDEPKAAVAQEPKSKSASGGKYDSDWPKNAGETSCRDWHTVMTTKQKFVMAADMLTSVREEIPSDADATDFAVGITSACEPAPTMNVAEIAAAIFTIMDAG